MRIWNKRLLNFALILHGNSSGGLKHGATRWVNFKDHTEGKEKTILKKCCTCRGTWRFHTLASSSGNVQNDTVANTCPSASCCLFQWWRWWRSRPRDVSPTELLLVALTFCKVTVSPLTWHYNTILHWPHKRLQTYFTPHNYCFNCQFD